MKRGKVNMLVDLLSLVIFSLVVSTGLVLRAVLPPGSGRLPAEGGTHDQILVLWGLSRHQWGQIHTYLSIALLLVLSLHVALHWRFFSSAFGKKADPGLRRRMILGVVGLLSVVALAVAPLLSPVKTLSFSTDTSTVSPGRRIYELECGKCHSSEGRKIPRLPDGDEGVVFLRNAQPDNLHGALRRLSSKELDELVEYLRSGNGD
jgi:uncharacterized protein DUF4405